MKLECRPALAIPLITGLRLKKLDDILERKLKNMQKWDPDTFQVISWLRKTQHRFRKPILEPPAIVVNVPDKKFVDAVEACFSSPQLRACSLPSQKEYFLTIFMI